jgi:hypothetical protein
VCVPACVGGERVRETNMVRESFTHVCSLIKHFSTNK